MESKQDEVFHDKDEQKTRNKVSVSNISKVDGKDVLKLFSSLPDNKVRANVTDWKRGENIAHDASSADIDASAEVNMEASITADDFMRAGGFGARDDISSFLPVASDSTDFEAAIRDARGYEEPQGDICRPGLGWKEARETE
ncbi:uncharacterized protein LOC110773023 [Prunus avium]|uniref:Uncharacterized protein LOC110773023 n=1 Tax=Prunus avium TaxID=42229 RepID=A0A6P5U1Z5_PRUAV|nr:uncharacterized protein LOC110773023 [Prunus avium]